MSDSAWVCRLRGVCEQVHMLLNHTNTSLLSQSTPEATTCLPRSSSSPAMGDSHNGLERGSPQAHAAHVRLVEAALCTFVDALVEEQIAHV